MAIIGNSTPPVTLTAASETLTGIINAYGTLAAGETLAPGGGYGTFILKGAVVGFPPTNFNIINDGLIESNGPSSLDLGLLLGAASTVTNAGTISAGTGIAIIGTQAGSYIRNTGLIQGRNGGGGLYVDGFSSVNNTGRIEGGSYGVYLNAGGNLRNTGTILATSGIAATFGQNAIYNAGLIEGASTIGIYLSGDVTNAAGGYIRGNQAGIFAISTSSYKNPTTITNHGLINSGTAGICLAAGDTIINTGTINGGAFGVTSGSTPVFATSAEIFNQATGRITSPDTGLALFGVSTVSNAGYIEGGVGQLFHIASPVPAIYDSSHDGVYLHAGNLINTGTIKGGAAGVYLGAFGHLTNSSFIEAANTGIVLNQYSDVMNAGLVGGGLTGAVARGDQSFLANAGTIAGGQYGLRASAGAQIHN